MSPEIVIEMADLDIVHEAATQRVLVRQVNWRIARGEFWVVGGDQASGKTSLLSTAAGLNRPASGTLRIFGRDLQQATEQEQVEWRKRIGFVFEYGGCLFSHLSVAENIALPLQYHLDLDETQTTAKVAKLLDWAGLRSFADLAPSRLNPAIQQRVSLVRSLATPTEVLFLDNPLSGLSVREARWWLKSLRDLHEQRTSESEPMTIITTSGDFHGWLDVANRFAVIQDSGFLVVGGKQELTASQNVAVRDFLVGAN